jgi:hypothetical protein
MTSAIPPVRPGTLSQPDTGVNDRIADLERVVAELQRKDMNRATIGQGGTFRGFYDNGQLAFTFGKDVDDGVRKAKHYWPSTGTEAFQIGPGNPNAGEAEQMRFKDQSGKILFGTDGVAGYGFVEPLLDYTMYPIAGLNYVAGVPQVACQAQSFFYNAALWSQILVRNFTGTITSITLQLQLRHSNTDIPAVQSSTATSVVANSTIRKIIAVPQAYISSQFTYAEWLLTANGTGTVDVFPRMNRGVSRAFYNIAAGDQ